MSNRNRWRDLLEQTLGLGSTPTGGTVATAKPTKSRRAMLCVDAAGYDLAWTYVSGWRAEGAELRFDSNGRSLDAEADFFARQDVNDLHALSDEFTSGFVARIAGVHERLVVTLATEAAPSVDVIAAPIDRLEARLRATLARVASSDARPVARPRTATPTPTVSTAVASTAASPSAPNTSEVVDRASIDDLNLALLHDSGTFDATWYLATYPDVAASGQDPLVHFLYRGGLEGRDPSYAFQSAWYLEQHPEVAADGLNPLVHYLQSGEGRGFRPSLHFDPAYYRAQVGPDVAGSLLGHFLGGGYRTHSPNEFFDVGHYLDHQVDVRDLGLDPLHHYLDQGWREEREIHPDLSFLRYRDRLTKRFGESTNPLTYFLSTGRAAGEKLPLRNVLGDSTSAEALVRQIQRNIARGSHFEEQLIGTPSLLASATVRLFAFYLPQFHPFPENDEWWGKGFTEWTNVTRGVPRFVGHLQPRLPRDLGYYDLRNPEVMRDQIAMARTAGVTGFCFYYYWFDGKRLLERPVEAFLADRSLDLPFCLMWANENWTRRWDGFETDVLIAQTYDVADDEALIADFARHFSDPRYERIDGRPLLIVYRPGIIPDAVTRIAAWRARFEESHGENPLLLMVQGFGDLDPTAYGLDGAIEFPPHKIADGLGAINAELETFDADFRGHVMRYDGLVDRSRAVEVPEFPLIRSLTPSWDNEARKPGRGMMFAEATPDRYEDWLRYLVSWAKANPVFGTGQYVFVNAWNEWAEGAMLEPDTHHGVAYLNATTRALVGISAGKRVGRRVLVVGHDAYLHGAQLLTLNIVRTMTRRFGVEVTVLLLGGGPLVDEYRKLAEVHVLGETPDSLEDLLDRIDADRSSRTALCNTVVSGHVAEMLSKRGFHVVSLVHEFPRLIEERSLEKRAKAIADHADAVVFASPTVRRAFEGIVGELGEEAKVLPQGIYQALDADRARRVEVLDALGIPHDAKVVLNLGYGDLRKGYDLFLEVTKSVTRLDPNVHFVWVGNVHADLALWSSIDRTQGGFAARFHLVPFESDVAKYYAAADVLLLTSREDPFPSTVLEALATGSPVIAFDGGGGFVDAIRENASNGTLVPMADTHAMAAAVLDTLGSEDPAAREARATDARAKYDWNEYVFELLRLALPGLERVSVVIPNYNYARYLPERLSTIFDQEYPIYEVIVLDDASKDDSLAVIEDVLAVARRDVTIVANETNSGSVFRQWERGARRAKGDYVWIAEADDASQRTFLSDLLARFEPTTTLGFSDSRQVDGDGRELGESYRFYFDDLRDRRMDDSFRCSGPDFVENVLAVKNVILNVSAVVFRRDALTKAFDASAEEIREFKVAGDWRLYCELLARSESRVAYLDAARNVHRRHQVSVTHALDATRHLSEIEQVQTYASRAVSVGVAIRDDAAAYVDRVRRQFALDSKSDD